MYQWGSVTKVLDKVSKVSAQQGGEVAGAGAAIAAALRGVAKSVLVENSYVDRDYGDAYTALYGRQFLPPEKKATRYHFFSRRRPPDSSVDPAPLEDEYLGFVVVWPTHPQVIGRTCLVPRLWLRDLDDFGAKLITIPVEAHVAGRTLKLDTAPYASKDFGVSACATVASWLATEIVADLVGIARTSTTAITLAAAENDATYGRALPQLYGLNVGQIARSLNTHGLDPFVYDAAVSARWHRAPTLLAYLDSDIPPILIGDFTIDAPATAASNSQQEGGSSDATSEQVSAVHALTVVGYRLKADFAAELSPGHSFASVLGSLIVHDDRHGPFLELPVIGDDAVALKHPRLGTVQVNALIVPLPPHISSISYDAHLVHTEFLTAHQEEWRDGEQIPYFLRTRLVRSNDFKKWALNWADEETSLSARRMPMPKWIWLTEGLAPTDLRDVRARVVSDPTAVREAGAQRLLWAHADDVWYEFGQQ